jgi:phage baseplate assembly protein W
MATQLKKFYVGFRTRNYEEKGGSFDVYNVECVEQDILNAIFTVRGERLMMPNYGTRIPLMTFEPGDQQTIGIIKQDLMTVFQQEPRVEVVNLDVVPATEKNALVVVAKLNYLEFNVTKDLYITIESQ